MKEPNYKHMKRQKIFLSSTNKWDDVTYNVQARPLTELLPFHTVRATDRNKVIVGDDNVIYGVQGMSYTLIPNSLIKSCIDEVIGEHDVKILHNPRGEFSMNIHLPSEVFTVGDDRDTIQKSVIINNSYNARVPFSVQGKVLNVTEGRVREKGMRVSYYREICKNGLMGWSDEFMSYDSYVTWLSKGQPHNYDKVKELIIGFFGSVLSTTIFVHATTDCSQLFPQIIVQFASMFLLRISENCCLPMSLPHCLRNIS